MEFTLNNDHFCSKCQSQLLAQTSNLRDVFKTESLLCEVPEIRDFSIRAIDFFNAESFYYYSFWNAVTNNKEFLLRRLNCSYKRFYRFLIDLNAVVLKNKDNFDMSTFTELQVYLTKMYKVLILEIEHFDYIYPELVENIKLICEIASKLLDDIPFVLEKEEESSYSSPKQKVITVDDEISTEKMPKKAKVVPVTEKKLEVSQLIDMGAVKKNLRKVFHENKVQSYQNQKQILDQQLLNKGQQEINSLRKHFINNVERQSLGLYCYSDILSKCHLKKDSIVNKGTVNSDRGILDSKEFKESPNNPNYRNERIAKMIEEKKLKAIDEYMLSISTEYLNSVKETCINLSDSVDEVEEVKDKEDSKMKKEDFDFAKLIFAESNKDKVPIQQPGTILHPKKINTSNEEVSDESVFTNEEVSQEGERNLMNFIGMTMLKVAEDKGKYWNNEVKEPKRKDNKVKVEDWISHLSFNELIRQKKFDTIPKKTGVRINIDKKPGKYRKPNDSKEHNWAF